MKASHYNFFFSYVDGDFLLYNAISNSLIVIRRSDAHRVKEALRSGTCPDHSILKMLSDNNFLVPDDKDELKEIRIEHMAAKHACSFMPLTIAPTLKCNFKCSYCYEGHSLPENRMSESIRDSIISFAEANIKHHSSYRITWIGGEPLLAFDIISDLSRDLINVCDANGVAYTARIYTNGYLMDALMVEEFIACRIDHVQITIDGNEESHDRRRMLRDGGPTYRKIIRGLDHILNRIDNFKSVTIRINIDSRNADSIYELIEQLRMIDPQKKLIISLANTTHNGQYHLSQRDFAERVKIIRSRLVEMGYGLTNIDLPERIRFYCASSTIKGFVISPVGDLYKCVEDLGRNDRAVGNIQDNNYLLGVGEKNRCYSYEYIDFDPTKDPKCRACKHLPLCMGGCSLKRIDNNNVPQCAPVKYTLKDTLINYANLKKE